jgi:hypothetical protein
MGPAEKTRENRDGTANFASDDDLKHANDLDPVTNMELSIMGNSKLSIARWEVGDCIVEFVGGSPSAVGGRESSHSSSSKIAKTDETGL